MLSSRRAVIGSIAAASVSTLLPSSLISASARLFPDPVQKPPDIEAIRARVRQAITQGNATGVAFAVAHQGRIVLEEGIGWADREAQVLVTAHTPFSLASITKPFTATTLMTLAAEGKLDLDAPANRYLGGSRLRGEDRHPDAVTVRQLGAHCSGLPGIFQSYDQRDARLAPRPEHLLQNYGTLAYPPGTCYEYSNIGFAALDVIASRLAATDLATLMQQRVLTPLGLHDSFFDTGFTRRPSAAAGYDPSGKRIASYITSTPASGQLYSSVHDLACFALFTMKHPLPDQQVILADRWIDELLKPVFTGPSGVATTFGWFTGHLSPGVPIVFKGGGQPGVATILYMVPSKNLACLVLTNQSNARDLALSICDQLARIYLADWQQPEEDAGDPFSPFVVTPQFRGSWVGTVGTNGAALPVRLNVDSSDKATFSIGSHAAQPITHLHSEGAALIGNTTGSPDPSHTSAAMLSIKLIAHEGKLLGRVFATAGDPDYKNVKLPFILTLNRKSA